MSLFLHRDHSRVLIAFAVATGLTGAVGIGGLLLLAKAQHHACEQAAANGQPPPPGFTCKPY